MARMTLKQADGESCDRRGHGKHRLRLRPDSKTQVTMEHTRAIRQWIELLT